MRVIIKFISNIMIFINNIICDIFIFIFNKIEKLFSLIVKGFKNLKNNPEYTYFIILIILIFSILIHVLLVKEYKTYKINTSNKNYNGEVATITVKAPEKTVKQNDFIKYSNYSYTDIDLESLEKENSDTIAWLIVNNTSINYPIPQTTDNSYYLSHSFDKSYSQYGWVFADYRDTFDNLGDNTIIYGHNNLNKTSFGGLVDLFSNPSINNNNSIILKTKEKEYVFKIFSIYTIPTENYYLQRDFKSENNYLKFLNTLKERSIYNFQIEITKESKIITLSTCTNDNKGRRVVHGVLV